MASLLEDALWLVSSAAEPWLARVQEDLAHLPSGQRAKSTLGVLTRLRKELTAVRSQLVVEQVAWRHKAREKFRLAAAMFFTATGLEQATDEAVAGYKAARFDPHDRAFDLCCGIGGDLLALAQRSAVTGIDRDEVAALFAAANARVYGGDSPRCQTVVGDVAQAPLDGEVCWHCDPDRRPAGRRTSRPALGEPSLEVIDRLREQCPHAAIKLAPAAEVPANWAAMAELEWIGSRGECRQLVAWHGRLARFPGARSATIVDSSGGVRTVVGSGPDIVPVSLSLGAFLFEPHAAVLAARLSAFLCREHGLAAISPGIAYLTGDPKVADAALAAFEIRDVLPLDRKRLRAYCREHGIGRLEVKKRGVEIDPVKLRKEVVGAGDQEATLIVLPTREGVRAVFAKRVV